MSSFSHKGALFSVFHVGLLVAFLLKGHLWQHPTNLFFGGNSTANHHSSQRLIL